jgi:hypothetical protein
MAIASKIRSAATAVSVSQQMAPKDVAPDLVVSRAVVNLHRTALSARQAITAPTTRLIAANRFTLLDATLLTT